jgi:RNA polymerase sigma factor (sigma-70 family)
MIPKEEDIIAYDYIFDGGIKTIIPRCELSPEVDKVMYEELKKESNNNEVEFNKHRTHVKDATNHYEQLYKYSIEDHVSDEVFKIIQSKQLKKAINTLLPKEKKLLYEKFCENKTNTEIAKAEGGKESTIRYRLGKIYNKLQNELE